MKKIEFDEVTIEAAYMGWIDTQEFTPKFFARFYANAANRQLEAQNRKRPRRGPKFRVLDVEAIREYFRYDHDEGRFFVRASGKEVGSKNVKGYMTLSYGSGRTLYAHRVAWICFHGIDPAEMHIDHKDGDKSNNRIANLRLATAAQNVANSGARSTNKLGVKGVYKVKGKKGYDVEICPNGNRIYVGRFQTVEEAQAAYENASKQHFGEFHHA